MTFLTCALRQKSPKCCVFEVGGVCYQCFGWMQQSEREAEDWTEEPEDAETALGFTAHTRLAQQLLKSVCGWVSVHILSVHVCICVCMYGVSV